MLLLAKEDIKQVFFMKDAIEADKEAFRIFSAGQSDVPLRTQLPAEKVGGTFLFMPSYSSALDYAGLKIVNVFPENLAKGLATTQGLVMLIDGLTGAVCAVLDGTYVTQVRTGAASGAAFELLARRDACQGALIGTGGQAAAQLEAMVVARNLTEVRIAATHFERTQAFADRMQEELAAYGTKFIAVRTADEAVADADVIVSVTPAEKPVYDGRLVKPGATVSCVGSYQPQMQETDAVVFERASKIYFDSRAAVLAEAGDVLIPLASGTVSEHDFTGELGELIAGKIVGRENDDEIIVFKTVGIGTQDLVTAKWIYDRAVARGIGTRWGEQV